MKKPNTYRGSIFLIAGSTIGAGMLALPVIAGQVGLVPALILYGLIWFYMLSSGLLLFEALSWTPKKTRSDPQTQFLNSVALTLGPVFVKIVILLFMGLFTCLMIAYLDKGGALLWSYCVLLLEKVAPHTTLLNQTPFVGTCLLTGITIFVLCHSHKMIDYSNRIGVYVLVGSFMILICLCLTHIDTSYFSYTDFKPLAFVIPYLITSFGFHNMLPTIAEYTGNFSKRTVKAIIMGSSIPLVIYSIWTFCMLGLIPPIGPNSLNTMFKEGKIATEFLIVHPSHQALLKNCASVFAFTAILTSIFGQGLSVTTFMTQWTQKFTNIQRTVTFVLFCFLGTYLWPNLFMLCLEYAGGIFAITLFGLIPSHMVLKGRLSGLKGEYQSPFSTASIYSIMIIGYIILGLEILKIFKIIRL